MQATSTETGTVERVTFHNADTGFAVLKVQARGKRDLVTVVGHAATIGAGRVRHSRGSWVTDRTHGLQFKAQVLKATPPTGAEGIEKYLASGQMRGIGPAMAKRIVAIFGDATFDIIEAELATASRRCRASVRCAPPGSRRAGPSRKRCGRS